MAKRTVDELDGKRKREEARDEARRELDATMAKFAAAEPPAPALPERKSLKEGQGLCCSLADVAAWSNRRRATRSWHRTACSCRRRFGSQFRRPWQVRPGRRLPVELPSRCGVW